MKVLAFTYEGIDYYLNGHSSHRMKVRGITVEEILQVLANPSKPSEPKGYGILVEGVNTKGKKVKVFYRTKPAGHREILTAIKEGR